MADADGQARQAAPPKRADARRNEQTLHASFLDRLVPACAQLLDAAVEAGQIRPDVDAFGLLHGVGNLCAGAGSDKRYDARRLAGLLIAALLQYRPTSQ